MLKKLYKFILSYPRLSLAILLVILSIFSIIIKGLKEGPELKGGIVLQLYVPGYTVELVTNNYTQLEKIQGIEILGSLGKNKYLVVVFDNKTLQVLKSNFKIISVKPELPPAYLYNRIVNIIRARINALGISSITVGTWGNKYIIIEAPMSVKDQIHKILELGHFEIRVNNVTVATGKDVISSSVRVSKDEFNRWGVDFILTTDAAKKLLETVKKFNFKVNISILFEGKVIFTAEPAPDLVAEWKSGKLVTAFRAITGTDGYYEIKVEKCDPSLLYSLGAERVEIKDNHTYYAYFSYPISSKEIIKKLNSSKCQVILVQSSKEKAESVALALRSGSLPARPIVISSYYVEPVLAKEIKNMIIILFLAAFIGVFLVIYLRYKKVKYVVPIYLTLIMEIIIILGVASAIDWVIDLPAIIGLLMVVATGVDDQIVILDEVIFGKKVKRAIQGAFFIIYVCAATTIATISPLFWIYHFRGFALTTTLGILIAVFITRPAYAEIVEKLFKIA